MMMCITNNKYLVRVLVVLLHARFSVVGPIPFLLAAIFFPVHPYYYRKYYRTSRSKYLPPPGGYVFVGFIYLFICLSPRLRKNLQADLDETLWVSWP